MKIEYDRSVFRDVLGRRLTIGLFKETNVQKEKTPPFSLEDWRKVYVETRDPSEYKAAMALIGDWDHWLYLRESSVIKPYVDAWAVEMDALLKSEAMDALQALAKSPGGAAAAKWLAEGQYKEKKAVGRPKKEKDEPPASKDEQRIMQDAERLFRVK